MLGPETRYVPRRVDEVVAGDTVVDELGNRHFIADASKDDKGGVTFTMRSGGTVRYPAGHYMVRTTGALNVG